jgi:hypothetical protein
MSPFCCIHGLGLSAECYDCEELSGLRALEHAIRTRNARVMGSVAQPELDQLSEIRARRGPGALTSEPDPRSCTCARMLHHSSHRPVVAIRNEHCPVHGDIVRKAGI